MLFFLDVFLYEDVVNGCFDCCDYDVGCVGMLFWDVEEFGLDGVCDEVRAAVAVVVGMVSCCGGWW